MDRFWADANFCSVVDVSEITRWESAVFHEKRKRGRFGGKDGRRGEIPDCRYWDLFCDGAERRAELGGWDVY